MSSASHCEIERDLGNPYSVELATGFFGYGTKTKPAKTEKWVARAGQGRSSGAAQQGSSGSSDDAASDGHGGWLQEAHSGIKKLKAEADQKHAEEQAHIKEKHAQAHANISNKQELLKQAEKLHIEHEHAITEHAKMEAVRANALKHHEEQVQGAQAKSNAASKAAEDAKHAFLGTSHHNAEASSGTGHDSSDWDDVKNHENMYSEHNGREIRSREIHRELSEAETKGAFNIGRHQVDLSNSTREPKPPPRRPFWKSGK